MNISSKNNFNSPNFGFVRKTAETAAIRQAKGVKTKLNEISQATKELEGDVSSIIGVEYGRQGRPIHFTVDYCYGGHEIYDTFKEACNAAKNVYA